MKSLELEHLTRNLKKVFRISDIKIDYTSNGKPFLKNVKNIHFSISHCDDLLVIVIDNKNIGVDVERIRDYDLKINNIIKYNAKSNEDFFREWTKREAVIKLKGLALRDINSLNYTGINFKIRRYKNYIITIAYEI